MRYNIYKNVTLQKQGGKREEFMQSRKKTILVLALLMFACMIAMPVQASAAAKLNKKSATLYTGATLKLKVTGTSQKVKWLSSKPSVATVSQSGKVKALKNKNLK